MRVTPRELAGFDEGQQPCNRFSPVETLDNLERGKIGDRCGLCKQRIALCGNCGRLHHECGADTCTFMGAPEKPTLLNKDNFEAYMKRVKEDVIIPMLSDKDS